MTGLARGKIDRDALNSIDELAQNRAPDSKVRGLLSPFLREVLEAD